MQDTTILPLATTPWWKRTWGILLILVGSCLFIFGSYVGYLVYDNIQLIKHGVIKTVPVFNGKFTADKKLNSEASVANDVSIVLANTPLFGDISNTHPKLTIVEFGDFQCPFCKEEFPIFRSLMQVVIPGVQFAFRQFPLADIHPFAIRAAEGSMCAQDQDKFWAYHDQLYLNQEDLTDDALSKYATIVGLDVPKFNQCLTSGTHHKDVMKDLQDGTRLGVKGTPTFFINGVKLEGVIPSDVWRAIFQKFGIE